MSTTFLCIIILLYCLGCTPSTAKEENAQSSPATPIMRGHAHNDYLHPRPLFDALDNGFCSVEVDVFLVNDALLVAHFSLFVRPERTLESLYLQPLRERARQFDGKIFPDAERFYLWIELKSEAQSTYTVLRKVLEQYADILTRYENGVEIPGAVTVILTGNAGLNLIQHELIRYVCVDGRLSALHSDISASFIPVVSLNWVQEFSRFRGELSPAQQEKLAEHIRNAHAHGRKLRYWNAPDNETFWKILHDAGVDLINTDRLGAFRNFIKKLPTAKSDNEAIMQ
jgi:phosphoribulokinase